MPYAIYGVKYDTRQVFLISSSQIRAARAILGISAEELSQLSTVPHRTVQRFETAPAIPPSRSGTLERVKAALEEAGIEFIGDPITSPGVRLRLTPDVGTGVATGR